MTRPLLFRTHSEEKEVKSNSLRRDEAVAVNKHHVAEVGRADDSPSLAGRGWPLPKSFPEVHGRSCTREVDFNARMERAVENFIVTPAVLEAHLRLCLTAHRTRGGS